MMPFLFLLSCIMPRKKGLHFYLVLGLFAIYLVNGLIAIPSNSVTYDEMDHWSYGKRILMRKTDKIYPYDDASTMPITGLNAIPRAIQQIINPDLLKTDGGFSDIMNGRYVTLIICLLTGFYIYTWSKQLFGENGGLLSLFLFVFCPNLNGHGILLTTDAYTALFTVSTAYYYWKFIKQTKQINFLKFSVSIALAQIVKYSMLHLFIIFGIISLFVLIKRRTIFSGIGRNAIRLIVLGCITILVINIAFLFNHPLTSQADFGAYSKLFDAYHKSFVGTLNLPLPLPYVEGLDFTMYMNDLGAGNLNVSDANYLLGEKRVGTGFWYYYLVVCFFKTPLTVLLIFLSAIIFLFIRKKKEGHPSTMLFLIGLILYFLILFGIQNNVQIGIRHVLMVYPLLYVLAGFFATTSLFKQRERLFKWIIPLYSIIGFYYFFPNLISYSNELIPVKRNAYKILADSNLDYGQGWYALEKYLKKHQDVAIIDTTNNQTKFVIGVNDYLDLKMNHKYPRAYNYKPTGQINHCFLLFDLTDPKSSKY